MQEAVMPVQAVVMVVVAVMFHQHSQSLLAKHSLCTSVVVVAVLALVVAGVAVVAVAGQASFEVPLH